MSRKFLVGDPVCSSRPIPRPCWCGCHRDQTLGRERRDALPGAVAYSLLVSVFAGVRTNNHRSDGLALVRMSCSTVTQMDHPRRAVPATATTPNQGITLATL